MDRLLVRIAYLILKRVIKRTKNQYDDKLLARLEELAKGVF